MKKVNINPIKYLLFKPEHDTIDSTIVLYHGWGTQASSMADTAEEFAKNGYTVIVPEIIYHDTRSPLENHFETSTLLNYFWKTIFESIDEFDEFIEATGVPKQKTFLVGSSMGGFIANGIFATQQDLGGLVNINGSGSFLFTENLFRKMQHREELSIEEEQLFKKYDPVGRKNGSAPVLLLHGDSDQTIPIDGQKEYYKYLTEVEDRNTADLYIYKGINHEFTMDMIKDVITWLNEKNKNE
jgi:dienelactone hydrolase